MKAQVELVGILHIVYSSLGVLFAIACYVFLPGIGIFTGDETAMGVLSLVGLVAGTFLMVVSVPGLVAGIGLLKLRPWARILAIIVSCLEMFSIPFGTALAIYTIYVLMNDEAIRMLSGERVAPPAVATPV